MREKFTNLNFKRAAKTALQKRQMPIVKGGYETENTVYEEYHGSPRLGFDFAAYRYRKFYTLRRGFQLSVASGDFT